MCLAFILIICNKIKAKRSRLLKRKKIMKSTNYQIYVLLMLHIAFRIHVLIISDCFNRYPPKKMLKQKLSSMIGRLK